MFEFGGPDKHRRKRRLLVKVGEKIWEGSRKEGRTARPPAITEEKKKKGGKERGEATRSCEFAAVGETKKKRRVLGLIQSGEPAVKKKAAEREGGRRPSLPQQLREERPESYCINITPRKRKQRKRCVQEKGPRHHQGETSKQLRVN